MFRCRDGRGYDHRPDATAQETLNPSNTGQHATGFIGTLMTDIISSDLSLWGLFISSFLAATLLPGGSEAVLFAVLKTYPESLWSALILASIGNTLGGMVTFGMGWMLPQFRHGGAEHSGAGETASGPQVRSGKFPDEAARARTQQLKHVDKARKYGTPVLLLAWMPLIGDALCLAAGWLRLNPLNAMLFMAIGKLARYAMIALAMS